MTDTDPIQFTILELKRTRQRIIEQLGGVEKQLSGLTRNSAKRPGLIELKNALLRQLREQNHRINPKFGGHFRR